MVTDMLTQKIPQVFDHSLSIVDLFFHTPHTLCLNFLLRVESKTSRVWKYWGYLTQISSEMENQWWGKYAVPKCFQTRLLKSYSSLLLNSSPVHVCISGETELLWNKCFRPIHLCCCQAEGNKKTCREKGRPFGLRKAMVTLSHTKEGAWGPRVKGDAINSIAKFAC